MNEDDSIESHPELNAALPTLVLLHFLGGSSREWAEVCSVLTPQFRSEAIDLPGFGDASEQPGYTVEEMADYVQHRISALQLEHFVLVGHSMGGKVAAVLARRAEDAPGSVALQGLVLVAASPAAPEPIEENKRQEMKTKLGRSGRSYREFAEAYIHENVAEQLPPSVMERAVTDVLSMNCSAWLAWLDAGSKEDWAARIGVLTVPTLVLAGEGDKALGAAAQTALVLPHFRNARLEVIADCAHLIPMEQPQKLAAMIGDFCEGLMELDGPGTGEVESIVSGYEALLQSDRVSDATRRVLEQRRATSRAVAVALTRAERATLQATCECVVPLAKRTIAFAAFINNRLGRGESKGWRYADLPSDLNAYRFALAGLDAFAQEGFTEGFASLSHEQRCEILCKVTAGKIAGSPIGRSSPQAPLTGAQMQRWFEDLRGEVTGIYMSDPATLAAIGYSGIADGADSHHLTGFVQVGLGITESWEPKPHGDQA